MGITIGDKLNMRMETMRAYRCANTWNFSRLDLQTEQWYPLHNSTFRVASQPWYLTFDGNLIM